MIGAQRAVRPVAVATVVARVVAATVVAHPATVATVVARLVVATGPGPVVVILRCEA